MYLLWKLKGLNPSEFKTIKQGEKIIIAAFMETYLKEEEEKYEAIGKSMK